MTVSYSNIHSSTIKFSFKTTKLYRTELPYALHDYFFVWIQDLDVREQNNRHLRLVQKQTKQ